MDFNKNKIMIIVAIVLVSIFITSCIGPNTEWCNIRDSYYKNDIYGSYGQFTAVNDNRIYYVNHGKDGDGVYSMDFDGSNVKFEFDTPKIVKLIVNSNEIYYIGLYNVGRKREEIYGLFKYDKSSGETELIYGDEEFESVQNVTIVGENEIIIRTIRGLHSSKAPESNIFKIGNETESFLHAKNLAEENSSYDFIVSRFDDYVLCNKEYNQVGFMKLGDSIGDSNDGVHNLINNDTLIWDEMVHKNCAFKAFYSKKNQLYIACYNELIVLDAMNLKKIDKLEFAGTHEDDLLDYACENDGKLYMVFTGGEYKSETKKIYVMDLKTYDNNELLELDSNSVLINIQNDSIIYASENKIICQEIISDGIGENYNSIKFESDITINTTFEVVGDWLFIYDRGKPSKTTALELLYKVNLETQEIFEE